MEPQSTLSDFNVEIVRIGQIESHPNADRLEVVKVHDYPVIVKKGDFKINDLAVYVPVDAIVPTIGEFKFLATHEGQASARVKAKKLRGVYSEGLLVPVPPELGNEVKPGVIDPYLLGIRKYVSPADLAEMHRAANVPKSKKERMLTQAAAKVMPVYGIDSGKRFPHLIQSGETVVVTEKIHGCNARYLYKDGRLYVGSHRTMRGQTRHRLAEAFTRLKLRFLRAIGRPQRTDLFERTGDIWWEIAEQYQLKAKLAWPCAKGLVFYGEIYGKGVQKRGGVEFVYDATDAEPHKFRVFDIFDPATKTFLSYKEMRQVCVEIGLNTAPCLAWAAHDPAQFERDYGGKETLTIAQRHIREGVVVRTDGDTRDPDRRVLKFVSEAYKLLGAGDEE